MLSILQIIVSYSLLFYNGGCFHRVCLLREGGTGALEKPMEADRLLMEGVHLTMGTFV